MTKTVKFRYDKTQSTRLLDVFLLGPFMIWFGASAKGLNDLPKVLMILSGMGTIVYNANNYIKNLEQ